MTDAHSKPNGRTSVYNRTYVHQVMHVRPSVSSRTCVECFFADYNCMRVDTSTSSSKTLRPSKFSFTNSMMKLA